MLDSTMKSYNEIVDIIESCTVDLLDCLDFEDNSYDKLFEYINQRLSYFSLEVLFKFSHNH